MTKPDWKLAVATLGLGLYLVLFFSTRLPSLEDQTGRVMRRSEFFWYLFLPDQIAGQWFGSPPQFALAERISVLAIAAAIVGVATAAGWLALVLCRAEQMLTRLEAFVFAAGVGLNLVSTYTLLVGLVGLLNRWVFAAPAVVVVAGAIAVWIKRRRLGTNDFQPPSVSHEQGDGFSPRWVWLAAPFALVIVLGGMLPPIEFDVREYHLQVPKEFFEQGSIGFLPHNVYGNMALGSEMHSLLAMVIAGDWWRGAVAGKTVIALFAPLTALGLLAAGRRFFSPGGGGAVAAVLYLSTPWVVQVSTIGWVEGASAFYLLAAFYALVVWQRSGRAQSLALAGLAGYLAGAATATKYPGLLFVGVPLTAWLVCAGLRTDWRRAWKPFAVFVSAAALGCGLWFAKNWVLAGNPTYPMLYGLFGGRTLTPEKAELWNYIVRPHDFSFGALGADLRRVVLESEWLGPLLIPLAVFGWLAAPKRRLVAGLWAYFAFVVVAWWLFALRIDRYWVPALAVVALAAGAGATWRVDAWWRRLVIGAMVLSCVYCLLVATTGPGGYNRFFVSYQVLRTAPERVDPWHLYFNRHVKAGRVLMVGEAEVFDLEVPVLYNTWLDDSIFERLLTDPATGRVLEPAEIRKNLAAADVSYVFVHWAEIQRYRASGYGQHEFITPALFAALVAQKVLVPLAPLEEHDGRAYRVRPEAEAGE